MSTAKHVGEILVFLSFYFVTPAFLSESILKRLIERSLVAISALVAFTLWVLAAVVLARIFKGTVADIFEAVHSGIATILREDHPLLLTLARLIIAIATTWKKMYVLTGILFIAILAGVAMLLTTKFLKDRVVGRFLTWLSDNESGRSNLALIGGVMFTVGGLLTLVL